MSTRGARAIAFTIQGPLERSDLPGLCDRVCAILQDGRPEVAYCEVSGVEADAVSVDALARLRKKARKAARNIDWRDAEARHELRIGLKLLRYACDALLRLPPQLERLQDTLGELNDLDVAAARLADLGGEPRLARRIAVRERLLIGRLAREWQALDRRKLPASARRA